ncbi:MAG: DMT family transporter [Candidatus Hodarchaeales archaeon]|jgi:drug/metabolite transporter (DMT)-like permease
MIEPLFSSLITVFVAFCWAVNAHVIKKGMIGGDEHAMLALAIRAVFAFPLLIVLAIFLSGLNSMLKYLEMNIFIAILISSSCLVIGDGIFGYALKYHPVKVIVPITGIYPLVTTIILISTGLEDVTPLIIIGTILIVIGVAVVTRGDSNEPVTLGALMLGIIPAIFWGVSIILVRYILSFDNTEAISLTGIRLFFIGLFSLIIFISSKENIKNYSERSYEEKMYSFKYLGLSGIVGWTIAATLFFYAIQNIGASIPTPISSIYPIIATLIGVILGIETITKKQFTGITTCVFGTILIII